MKQEYTITILTENQVSLISKIDIILARRKIKTESVTIHFEPIENLYKFSIVLIDAEIIIKNLVLQIRKTIGIIDVFASMRNEVIENEIALFKICFNKRETDFQIEKIVEKYKAKTILITKDFTVFEVSGRSEQLKHLVQELRNCNLIEFVKSGRISITKSNRENVLIYSN